MLFGVVVSTPVGRSQPLRITATIPVGAHPIRLALTPNARALYVTNHLGGTLTRIDTGTRKVTATLPAGDRPANLTISPDASAVWVVGNEPVVRRFDTRTSEATKIPTGAIPRDLAITPDGTSLYLAAGARGLLRIDTRSLQLSVVHPAPAPDGLAIAPDGRTLYVNYRGPGLGGTPGHDAIARFDAHTGAFLGAITTLANVGSWIAVSPDGTHVWSDGLDACWSPRYDHRGCPIVPAGLVNILDASLARHIRTIPFSGSYQPDSIAFSPDGSLVVLTGNVLQVLDPSTGRELSRIENRPFRGFVFHPNRRVAYSALQTENSVAILSIDEQ